MSLPRRPPARSSASFASTTATKQQQQQIPLSRRLLFPFLPGSTAELPPLLNDTELDAELYDFIALALRAFVTPWWSKISRNDKEFLSQINRILSIVIRSLNERLQATDLSPLALRTIPELVTQHYKDYRNAASKTSSSYATGGAASLTQLFHQLQPHVAISSDGQLRDEYYRQVVDHILKVCLPPEDYAPEAERFIVQEIILKVLVHDIVPKISQPWFIHQNILNQLGPVSDKANAPKPPDPVFPAPTSFLSIHTILIFLLSTIQTISGACLALAHAYKHMVGLGRAVKQHHENNSLPIPPVASSSSSLSEEVLTPVSEVMTDPLINSDSSSDELTTTKPASVPKAHPLNYTRPLLEFVKEVLGTDTRYASNAMYGTLSMTTALFSHFFNQLILYFLEVHVFTKSTVITIVRAGKQSLFPNGYPASSPPDPTPEEQVLIRQALVRVLAAKSSGIPGSLVLGPDPTASFNAILDPLSSAAINTHLIVFLVDAVLLALFPELGVVSSEAGA